MTTLADNALTTLDVIASEIDAFTEGESDDDRVTRYINIASDAFEQHTRRKWYHKEDHEERLAGYGTNRLTVIDHLPIESVASIVYDDGDTQDTIDADDYEVEDGDLGWIRHIGGVWDSTAVQFLDITTERRAGSEAKLWRVTYTGGYVTQKQVDDDPSMERTLPYDVEQAIVEYVKMLWSTKGRDPTVASMKLGDGSVSYANVGGQPVPAYYASVVNRYRDRVVA